MRTNPNPHFHTTAPGARSEHATRPQLRFKTEDFEKTIDFLPRSKQNFARSLFPKDSTGRWMKTDEAGLKTFMNILDPHERETLGRALQDNKISVNPGRMSEEKTANLKDSGRFTPEPAPQARRPAQGADLNEPFGFQAAPPRSMEEDPHPAPSGSAHGKPGPESPKPERVTLADLFAAEDKAGRLSPGSLHDMPKPPGGQNHETPPGGPNPAMPPEAADGRRPAGGVFGTGISGTTLAVGAAAAAAAAILLGGEGGGNPPSPGPQI